MARPFKVLIPEQKEQFGVVARSLRVLRDSIQKRCGFKSSFKIFLTDGTVVDNEEYFAFLEPQTLLIVKYAIPSGDTKTSVVDLTSKEVQALICRENETHEQPLHQQQAKSKDVCTCTSSSQRTENKNAGTQTLAVMSIQIAKVQGDVQWENEGISNQSNDSSAQCNVSSAQCNVSSAQSTVALAQSTVSSATQPNASTHPLTHYHQQQALIQSEPAAVSKPSMIMHHHLSLMSCPTSQTTQTYSTTATSRASVATAFHQQPQQQQQQLQQQQIQQLLQSGDTALLQQLYQQGQLQKRYVHYHQQHQQQQISSPCNANLRPSQRYYVQQFQGRSRNYHIVHQLSSCGYNGADVIQQQQQQHQRLSCLPPY